MTKVDFKVVTYSSLGKNSRTKRNPTPDFLDNSICVRLYCLRIAFTCLDGMFAL